MAERRVSWPNASRGKRRFCLRDSRELAAGAAGTQVSTSFLALEVLKLGSMWPQGSVEQSGSLLEGVHLFVNLDGAALVLLALRFGTVFREGVLLLKQQQQ